MIDRDTKLKLRRQAAKRRRQVENLSNHTEENIDKHLIRRLVRLPNVQRFLIGWIGLLFVLTVGLVLQMRVLNSKYQNIKPIAGGTYSEGIIGSFTNANPIYTSGSVDSSVSELVFAGLLKYDDKNQLVGDLAENYSVDPTEKIYTVKLKKNLKWHDGQPLTSKDIVFTYQLIQNPETKSQLFPSWQSIKIEAPDDQTVVFTIPNTLSSFPHSLTNGIVPEHILKSVRPEQMRSNTFNNQQPVGSGPFKFSQVEVVGTTPDDRQERIALTPFDLYHAGRPKLDSLIIKTYPNEKALMEAYGDKEINAMVGLAALPDEFKENKDVIEFSVPLTGEVLVFFKTNQEVLKDPAVRKALVLAADKGGIFGKLPYPLASIDEPLLRSHVGYDKSLAQATGNADEAAKALDAAGWVVDQSTGIRTKDGVKLSFRLYSQSTSEYSSIAGSLQKQWRDLGVDAQVELQNDQELQSTLALHNYDALLYGISIGSDPDVFAYWHSSQADPRSQTRLNFSEYRSPAADRALEDGRTRSDPQIRQVKYHTFLEAWRNDAPALALYQPRFLYIVRAPLHGYDSTAANSAADRYADVQEWTVREGR